LTNINNIIIIIIRRLNSSSVSKVQNYTKKEVISMKLARLTSRPTYFTFVIALIVAIAALLMVVLPFKFLLEPVWWALIAFTILAIGNLFKDA
jgi:hypothetical protein